MSSHEFPHAASSRENIRGSLVVRKQFLGESLIWTLLNIQDLVQNYAPPIEIEWSLTSRPQCLRFT